MAAVLTSFAYPPSARARRCAKTDAPFHPHLHQRQPTANAPTRSQSSHCTCTRNYQLLGVRMNMSAGCAERQWRGAAYCCALVRPQTVTREPGDSISGQWSRWCVQDRPLNRLLPECNASRRRQRRLQGAAASASRASATVFGVFFSNPNDFLRCTGEGPWG